MKLLSAKNGQAVLEFTILIVAVVLALASMSSLIKRGVQGRFKMGADAISQRQYAPGKTVILGD